jgi:hypothetical protein
LQVFGFRALQLLFTAAELLVLLQVIVIGLDDDLRQFAGLAAGGAAEGRPIGERDRLRWGRLRTIGAYLSILNHDSPDQHGLPVRWCVRR